MMVRPRRQLAVAKFVQVPAQHPLGAAAEGSRRLWDAVRNILHGAPKLLRFLITLTTFVIASTEASGANLTLGALGGRLR